MIIQQAANKFHPSIHLHLLHRNILASAHLGHGNILANLLPRNQLLIQDRRRPPLKPITPLLPPPLIRRNEIPHQRSLLRRNHTNIDITPRSQIVENTRLDRLAAQLYRVLPRQLRPPLGLEDGHGGHGAGAHGHVGQLVGGAVRVHGEEAYACGVDACYHEVGADVALVAEEVLLEHRHAGHDAGLATRG